MVAGPSSSNKHKQQQQEQATRKAAISSRKQNNTNNSPETVRAVWRRVPRRVPEGWCPKAGVRRVGAPGGAPKGWRFEGWAPQGGGAHNFAFFFPSPATIFILSSSRVVSWNFGGVIEGRGRANVHIWSSRAVV